MDVFRNFPYPLDIVKKFLMIGIFIHYCEYTLTYVFEQLLSNYDYQAACGCGVYYVGDLDLFVLV